MALAQGTTMIKAIFGRVSGTTAMTVPTTASHFVPTGGMSETREFHTATLLNSGKVLITGGNLDGSSTSTLATAELYNPVTGSFSSTGSMSTTRSEHTATLLPNGKVLVAGGSDSSSAEVYDPSTGTFTLTGSMSTSRTRHTATLLPNGKVLVTGGTGSGSSNTSGTLASSELYDPVAGTFSLTGSMNTDRFYHTATLLPSGKVLITGGSGSNGELASAELYDTLTGTFSLIGSMNTARIVHTATLLISGKVLVTGGHFNCMSGTCDYLASAEVYDPASGIDR